MLIDWFTIFAQVINFLILVWLLKRFLYKPILNAIDEREKRIAKELADADAKKAEAKAERDEFQHKNEEFDKQRASLLDKATAEAKTERKRLLDEARQAADLLSSQRQETLKTDAHNLNQALSRRAQQEVFAIARKALTDLAGENLEERMVGIFIQRLRDMDSQTKADLAEALKTATDSALVRSAFALPAAQQAAIQKALNEIFSAEIRLRYETAADLVSGIELSAGGHKIAWSIADYLLSLKNGVDELLKEKDKAEAQAQAKKPSALTQQIGKRAYQLYEEHGHNPGHESEDWKEAERQIRQASLDPVQTDPKPETKPKPEPEPKPDAKAKPEKKVTTEPAVKTDPEAESAAGPKPETKPEPEPEPDAKAKSENKVAPDPAVKTDPEAESADEPKPEQPKPEAKTQ